MNKEKNEFKQNHSQQGIVSISAEQTYPLRHTVLRPNDTLQDCIFPLDEEPNSYHAGYYTDGQLIGVATIVQDPPAGSFDIVNGVANTSSWRIRGMAVDERYRGTGVGGELLKALIHYAALQIQAHEIWCNAREDVQGFYERFGFERIGDVFDIPTVGPHVFMKRLITAQEPRN